MRRLCPDDDAWGFLNVMMLGVESRYSLLET